MGLLEGKVALITGAGSGMADAAMIADVTIHRRERSSAKEW